MIDEGVIDVLYNITSTQLNFSLKNNVHLEDIDLLTISLNPPPPHLPELFFSEFPSPSSICLLVY